MKIIMNSVLIAKGHLLTQTRSYTFFLIIGLTLFLSYLFIPSADRHYEVFYIGGVRGVYNSAWLGGMLAMVSNLLLWLFGFYFLRGTISKDEQLRVAPFIATSPITKSAYIWTKVLANFIILVIISASLLFSFMFMQIIRAEDTDIIWGDYLMPYFCLTLPSLFLLASLTIVFDVIGWLKGTLGNVIFFCMWIAISVLSISFSNVLLDLFGLNTILSNMVNDAAQVFPFLKDSDSGGSFGYYPVANVLTFTWEGIVWTKEMLISVFLWGFIAVCNILLAIVSFNRFQKQRQLTSGPKKQEVIELTRKQVDARVLSPVQFEQSIYYARLIIGEWKVLLRGYSKWLYGILIISIILSFALPMNILISWSPLFMLFPLAIWSKMGTVDTTNRTEQLILSTFNASIKYFITWLSGLFITLIYSFGFVLRLSLAGDTRAGIAYVIGIMFIVTLAITLGYFTKSRRVFESIYLLLWYMGPVNQIPYLDFAGLSTNHSLQYFIISIFLMGSVVILQKKRKEKKRKGWDMG
ncbi:MAG: hypothetical protein RR588_08190 [Solibacillus sp.]